MNICVGAFCNNKIFLCSTSFSILQLPNTKTLMLPIRMLIFRTMCGNSAELVVDTRGKADGDKNERR